MDPIVIHPTTLDKLSSCKLQYFWSRSFTSIHKSLNLEFGIAIHVALEEYYAHDADPVKVFKDYILSNMVVLGEENVLDLGVAMLRNYLAVYKGENFEVVATELEIARRVPIPKDDPEPVPQAGRFHVGSRVDAIVLDKTSGRYFVLEHKTFETFYASSLSTNHQFVIEKFVSEGWLKKPIAGVIYNGLRKKMKATSSTKLFERHFLVINTAQVDVMLHRVYWQLSSLYSGNFKIYPEPDTFKCNMCGFKAPCAEYMRGGDYKFILNNLFTERVEDDNEWA